MIINSFIDGSEPHREQCKILRDCIIPHDLDLLALRVRHHLASNVRLVTIVEEVQTHVVGDVGEVNLLGR